MGESGDVYRVGTVGQTNNNSPIDWELQYFTRLCSDFFELSCKGELIRIMAEVRGIPLRTWIEHDAKRKSDEQQGTKSQDESILSSKQSLLRRTTVAFGIVELLKNARVVSTSQLSAATVGMDNFVVHTSAGCDGTSPSWDDVSGVSMLSPSLTAQIIEPSFLANFIDESNGQKSLGRFLEVDIPLPGSVTNTDVALGSESNDCQLFGILLYEIYSGINPFPAASNDVTEGNGTSSQGDESPPEPARKKSSVRYDKRKGKSYSTLQTKTYTPLQEFGFPSSICMMVEDLIDCHGAYSSLVAAKSDIHLLLNDPSCFLHEIPDTVQQEGSMQLRIKIGKLYGREMESTSITEAYCRVCSGNNEAFFIGGYSGSGKTMLVNSLRARVDIAGGAYVLTQKVDQMAKERGAMLDVLSAFNNLCSLIRDKNSPQELLDMANRIGNEFESDFSVLARLVPNIKTLFRPELAKPNSQDATTDQIMNFENISFTLQRFMRIVSSRQTPVMLFLDDLQWASSITLKLIQALLLDKRGSSCFFFVGNYRDNEVTQEHPIFDFMSDLDSCGVTSTNIILGGLNRNDLNLMIAESLCTLPHLCKSLAGIVSDRTNGNPLFAIQSLKSMIDSRLLKYSLRQRRWIWDESKIRAENVTDNVIYLLTAKMASLPENTQKALKVISCFGIKTDESLVESLDSTPQYSGLMDGLKQSINEGCLQKFDSEYKFVHDKTMEAAYSLIPDNEKNQVSSGVRSMSVYELPDNHTLV